MVNIIDNGASSGDLKAIIVLVRNEEHAYVMLKNLSSKYLIKTILQKGVKQKIVYVQSGQVVQTNLLCLYQHSFQSFCVLFFNWFTKNCKDAIIAITHSGTAMEVTPGDSKVIDQDSGMNIGSIETNKCPGLLNLKDNPLSRVIMDNLRSLRKEHRYRQQKRN